MLEKSVNNFCVVKVYGENCFVPVDIELRAEKCPAQKRIPAIEMKRAYVDFEINRQYGTTMDYCWKICKVKIKKTCQAYKNRNKKYK